MPDSAELIIATPINEDRKLPGDSPVNAVRTLGWIRKMRTKVRFSAESAGDRIPRVSGGYRECRLPTIRRIDKCQEFARTAAAHHRASFRPALDGQLEDRELMSVADIKKDLAYSAYLLKHPSCAQPTCSTNRRDYNVRLSSMDSVSANGPAWPRRRRLAGARM